MTFAEQAQQEHARLQKRQQELKAELKEVESELKALDAYINAKGKSRTTNKRKLVLDEIAKHDGITRADLLVELGADETKSIRSVDNSLNALVKANNVTKGGDLYRTCG